MGISKFQTQKLGQMAGNGWKSLFKGQKWSILKYKMTQIWVFLLIDSIFYSIWANQKVLWDLWFIFLVKHVQWGRNGIYLGEDQKFFFIYLGVDGNHFFQILLLFSIKTPKFRVGSILLGSALTEHVSKDCSAWLYLNDFSKILFEVQSVLFFSSHYTAG